MRLAQCRRLTAALVLLVLAGAAAPTQAATQLQLLFDWACAPTPAKDELAKDIAQAKCNLPVDDNGSSACGVLSGTPWSCYDSVPAPVEDCWSPWDTTLTITSSSAVLGWSVQGTVTASASIRFSGQATPCSATRNATVNGQGGLYVSRSGIAAVTAVFRLTAGGSVTFLGNEVFGTGGKDTCNRSVNQKAHEERAVTGCGDGACNCCGYGCCNTDADCPAARPKCVVSEACPCRCPGTAGHCFGGGGAPAMMNVMPES